MNDRLPALSWLLWVALLFPRLSLLLGRNFQKALQVVDQNEVECFQGQTSGRRVFQVHLPPRHCML